jgi:hypothetical protein
MRSTWTLAVEGLGRIDRAEVELRPLTLFVGDNNSGKTYLTSLLWDLHARMPDVFQADRTEIDALQASPRYGACAAWLAEKLQRSEPYTLTQEDIGLLLAWLNQRLGEKKDAVVRRLFGREGMTMGGMRVGDLSLDAPFSLALRQRRNGSPLDITFKADGYAPGAPRVLEAELAPSPYATFEVLITLMAQLLSPNRLVGYLPPEYGAGDPVYLPAPRTGFMLLYKDVLATLIDRTTRGAMGVVRSPAPIAQLTVPAAHFLRLLPLDLKPEHRGPHAADADFIERSSFPGTIELVGGFGVNNIEYRYDSAEAPLPMQLSSSLVAELAPLILVLRHASSLPMLFLEEPEAHLHPKVQRTLVQVIARLVRKGVEICITTHSPDFCQSINNLIKLGSLPPDVRARFQAQYGYATEDYLEEKDVVGYEFQVGGHGRSTVTKLAGSEAGLAMGTFNEELYATSKQVIELLRAVEGAQ